MRGLIGSSLRLAPEMLDRAGRRRRHHREVEVFLETPARQAFGPGAFEGAEARLSVFTVVFNVPSLVSLQIEAMGRFAAGAFELTVIDNSSIQSAARDIEGIAMASGTSYVRLPPNPAIHLSESHGLALDWLYRHLVLPNRVRRMLLLDHDLFPVAPFDADAFGHGCAAYGHRQTRGSRVYLWPGFSYFDLRMLGSTPLSFRPSRGVDTGGRIASLLAGRADVGFATQAKLMLGQPGADQVAAVEVFDGAWLHLLNGSGWYGGTPKLDLLGAGDEPRSVEYWVRLLPHLQPRAG